MNLIGMNWYKKANNEIKTAWDWPRFLKSLGITIGVALIPMIIVLGLTQSDIIDLYKQSGNNEMQLKEYLEQRQSSKPEIEQPIAQVAPEQEYPQEVQQEETQEFNFDSFRRRLGSLEGNSNTVYDDRTGVKTIGIGHAMGKNSKDKWARASQKAFDRVFGNEVNWFSVFNEQQTLTSDQVNRLAEYDIQRHLDWAKKLFPKFDAYPEYLQEALLDSVFRGDTGRLTTHLINKGDWRAAADEYIDRRDYRNAIKNRMYGIRPRMDANRAAMLQYAKQIGQ
jgi:GH24 family phage-related lysozyme (muramidase)